MVNNLEEMIAHYEEVAEELEKRVKPYQCESINKKLYEVNKKEWDDCLECASEYRQLAEWLKELKKLREIPDKLVPHYRDGIQDEYNRGANEMLEEVIDDIRKYMEEVNADV